jgi:uncharacterized protein (TIGR00251 family)
MRIKIKVKPKSKKVDIKQISKDIYEVKLKSPPEKGKANQELIQVLSEFFNIPKSNIRIIKGKTSREKLVELL